MIKYLPFLLLLVSCTEVKKPTTAQEVAAQVYVTKDEFKKTGWVYGPRIEGEISSYWLLRASVTSKGNIGFIQIYGNYWNSDWAFLKNAVDGDGNRLRFIEIDRDAKGTGVTEVYALSVTREYLESKIQSGLKVKVYGKRDNTVIHLPGYYIEGFLNSL